MGRLVAKHLGDRLGQQVYVENIGGANGSIGTQAVMRAEPDGYTIGVISDGPMIVNPALYPEQRLCPAARLRPGRNGEPLSVDADGASVHRHQDRGRPHQGGQGEARHAELFLRRHRQFQPHGAGAAGPSDRHQAHPRSLSRHRSGDPGDPDRRGAASLQQRRHLAGTREGRQDQRTRHRRRQAARGPVGHADHRRNRSRIRVLGVDRHSMFRRKPRRTSLPRSPRRWPNFSRTRR